MGIVLPPENDESFWEAWQESKCLSDRDRVILLLCTGDDVDYQEIMDGLGFTVDELRTALERTLTFVREYRAWHELVEQRR